MDVTVTVVHPVCANVRGVFMTSQKKPKRLTKTTPPKKGPLSQGLQNTYKKIQIIKITK